MVNLHLSRKAHREQAAVTKPMYSGISHASREQLEAYLSIMTLCEWI